jgi:hypothetical protein
LQASVDEVTSALEEASTRIAGDRAGLDARAEALKGIINRVKLSATTRFSPDRLQLSEFQELVIEQRNEGKKRLDKLQKDLKKRRSEFEGAHVALEEAGEQWMALLKLCEQPVEEVEPFLRSLADMSIQLFPPDAFEDLTSWHGAFDQHLRRRESEAQIPNRTLTSDEQDLGLFGGRGSHQAQEYLSKRVRLLIERLDQRAESIAHLADGVEAPHAPFWKIRTECLNKKDQLSASLEAYDNATETATAGLENLIQRVNSTQPARILRRFRGSPYTLLLFLTRGDVEANDFATHNHMDLVDRPNYHLCTFDPEMDGLADVLSLHVRDSLAQLVLNGRIRAEDAEILQQHDDGEFLEQLLTHSTSPFLKLLELAADAPDWYAAVRNGTLSFEQAWTLRTASYHPGLVELFQMGHLTEAQYRVTVGLGLRKESMDNIAMAVEEAWSAEVPYAAHAEGLEARFDALCTFHQTSENGFDPSRLMEEVLTPLHIELEQTESKTSQPRKRKSTMKGSSLF